MEQERLDPCPEKPANFWEPAGHSSWGRRFSPLLTTARDGGSAGNAGAIFSAKGARTLAGQIATKRDINKRVKPFTLTD